MILRVGSTLVAAAVVLCGVRTSLADEPVKVFIRFNPCHYSFVDVKHWRVGGADMKDDTDFSCTVSGPRWKCIVATAKAHTPGLDTVSLMDHARVPKCHPERNSGACLLRDQEGVVAITAAFKGNAGIATARIDLDSGDTRVCIGTIDILRGAKTSSPSPTTSRFTRR